MDIRRIQQLVALDIVRSKGIAEQTDAFDNAYLETVGIIRTKWTDEQTVSIYTDFTEK